MSTVYCQQDAFQFRDTAGELIQADLIMVFANAVNGGTQVQVRGTSVRQPLTSHMLMTAAVCTCRISPKPTRHLVIQK